MAHPVVYTAMLGKLEDFDAKNDTVTAYIERAELFMDANTIPNDKRVLTLLSSIGKECYEILRNLLTPANPRDTSWADIVAALKSHFEPKPLVISERFVFNKRQQQTDELVANYVAALRKLSVHCRFGDFLDDALRDRFVCGLRSEAMQKKLLIETDLTFKRAIEIAQSMESAATKAKELQSHNPTTQGQGHEAAVYAVQHNHNSCHRCGKQNHTPDKCVFKYKHCLACGNMGHIKAMCRTKKLTKKGEGEYPTPQGRQRWTKKVRVVQEESEEDSDPLNTIIELHHIEEKSNSPYMVTVSLDGNPQYLEIDTGACITIMSEDTFKELLPQKKLAKSKARLSTYSGERLKAKGECNVTVEYQSQKKTLPLVVVEGRGPNLLGRNWLSEIRLDWKAINMVKSESALAIVLDKYPEVFREELGTLKGHKAKIYVDPDATPKYCKARPVPYAMQPKVEAELERLENEGIIKPVHFADWAAPIVPVLKPDKKTIRLCGDFKLTVNKASQLDRYPIPKIEDLFAQMAGGQKYTKLDLNQAYQQMELEEESRRYVVINTHRGLFEYTRLPFGVSSAPGIFQRVMESILRGIPNVVVYLDDILITGPDDETHLETLETVLKRLSEAGLRARKVKCVFLAHSVVYLGHKIDSEGLHPMPEKVKAIQEAPRPSNVSELKSYLGLLSYYSKFLPNLSTVMAPLYKLLQKKQEWLWESPQETAFVESKELLLSSRVLAHFNPKLEIRLACDASNYGIGAVLSHKLPNGQEKPIGFVSRSLSETERKYSQIEKEALSCVFGVTRFHSYLYGHKFTLQTDHKPLLVLFNENKAIPTHAANRIQRWAWKLASYEYTIKWRNTHQHANADAMSRLPLPEVPTKTTVPAEVVLLVEQLNDSPVTAQQVATWTRQNLTLAKVLANVQSGWKDDPDEDLRPYKSRNLELSVESGCLLWGTRVIVPPQGRERVLHELHDGHSGSSRMKAVAREIVWWPGLDAEIERLVKECERCQQSQPAPPSAPMQPWSWPTKPWSRLHIDYAGPVEGKMFLIVIDAHSKWLEVLPVSSATSFGTIQQLRPLIARFGIPDSLVSDNGTPFTSKEFEEFCKSNGIRHVRVAPYHPASNGLAERAVRIFKEGLKKQNTGTLQDRLSKILFKYRITPHTTTGMAPSELLMGKKLKSRLDLLKPSLDQRVQRRQECQKEGHDKRAKVRSFEVGENVYVLNHNRGSKWLPGTIVERRGPLSYCVELLDKRIVRCHQDHIRPRTESKDRRTESDVVEDGLWDVPTTANTPPATVPDQADSPNHETPTDSEPAAPEPRYPSRVRARPNYFGEN